jgi:hypothetical protein
MRIADAFTVYGYHFLGPGLPDSANPPRETAGKLIRGYGTENTVDGVMGRNAVVEITVFTQPGFLLFAKESYLVPIVGTAKHSRENKQQNICQFVTEIPLIPPARLFNFTENLQK